MKKVKVILERSLSGEFSAYMDCYDLEYGVNAQGASIEEAKANFEVVYNGMRSDFAREGKKFTEVTWEFEVDYMSLLEYYAQFFTLVGLSRFTGINKGQLSHYLNGTSRPRPATIERMQKGFAKMADDFRALSTI